MKYKQFKLRLDEHDHAELSAAAYKTGRTLNGELVARLKASLKAESLEEIIVRALTTYERRKRCAPVPPVQRLQGGLQNNNYAQLIKELEIQLASATGRANV